MFHLSRAPRAAQPRVAWLDVHGVRVIAGRYSPRLWQRACSRAGGSSIAHGGHVASALRRSNCAHGQQLQARYCRWKGGAPPRSPERLLPLSRILNMLGPGCHACGSWGKWRVLQSQPSDAHKHRRNPTTPLSTGSSSSGMRAGRGRAGRVLYSLLAAGLPPITQPLSLLSMPVWRASGMGPVNELLLPGSWHGGRAPQ